MKVWHAGGASTANAKKQCFDGSPGPRYYYDSGGCQDILVIVQVYFGCGIVPVAFLIGVLILFERVT